VFKIGIKRIKIFLLLFGLLYVPLVFKLIHPKQVAALYAGVFFIVLGFIFIFIEYKNKKLSSVLGLLAVVFTLCFAIPIFYMRVSHWGEPFESLSVFGISMKWMHSGSSILYVFMFIVELAQLVKRRRRIL
jgi:membrane-bound ClpP family serine protease